MGILLGARDAARYLPASRGARVRSWFQASPEASVRKGAIIRAIMVGVAIMLALTGNWTLLIFGAVCYQIGRIAAIVLERQSRRRREAFTRAV